MATIQELKLALEKVNELVAGLTVLNTGEEPPKEPKVQEIAPAYDACRGLWSAAEREGVFNIMPLLGGGIKPLAAQMYQHFTPNWPVIEAAIVALGHSPWGQEWVKHDVNAALLCTSVNGKNYCRDFTKGLDPNFPNGYIVARKVQNDDSQGYLHLA